jgi:hypothetical protein
VGNVASSFTYCMENLRVGKHLFCVFHVLFCVHLTSFFCFVYVCMTVIVSVSEIRQKAVKISEIRQKAVKISEIPSLKVISCFHVQKFLFALEDTHSSLFPLECSEYSTFFDKCLPT